MSLYQCRRPHQYLKMGNGGIILASNCADQTVLFPHTKPTDHSWQQLQWHLDHQPINTKITPTKRSSQVLEEMMNAHQWKFKRLPTNHAAWTNGSSNPDPHHSSFNAYSQNHRNNSSLKLDFEPPFRIQLNEAMLRQEKQWLPDLQLGLSLGGSKENKEISTELSLS